MVIKLYLHKLLLYQLLLGGTVEIDLPPTVQAEFDQARDNLGRLLHNIASSY